MNLGGGGKVLTLGLLAGILSAGGLAAGAQAAAPPLLHGGFRVLGPGGGGTLYDPAISPLDPQTMVASSDMSGSYITHDGGQTWRMFNLRGAPRQFVFDPVDPHILYALGIGIWKSSDSGETWDLVAPSPSSVRGVSDASDEADIVLLSSSALSPAGFGYPGPTALAIDPQDHLHLYAAVGQNLSTSHDGGIHWSDQDRLPGEVTDIAFASGGGKPRVLLAGDHGVMLSTGKDARPLATLRAAPYFHEVRIDVIGDKVLALATFDGGRLFQTWIDPSGKNPGTPWKELKLPGTGGQFRVAVSGHDGKTIYASYDSLRLDGKEWEGVAKSEDMGEHWTLALQSAGPTPSNLAGDWIETEPDFDWPIRPTGLAVSTKDPGLIFATNMGGVFKSVDAGAHWSAIYSRTAPDGGAVSNGIDVLTNYGTFFDPFNPRRIFVGYVDIGLMRSETRGESWRTSTAGVPEQWHNSTYWMVFDPDVRGRVWAAKALTHDLPRARMWRNRPLSSFAGGVCVSDDGGVHWSVVADLPNGPVTYLMLDPRSPASARTMYAAVFGHGVYKSVDGGVHWVQKNKGIQRTEPMVWRLAMASDGTLYAIVAREWILAPPGEPRAGSLYRSRDGGETWEPMSMPAVVSGPTDIAVDPRQPSRLYLSAWPYEVGQRGAGGGLFASDDAGLSWKSLLPQTQHVSSVTIDPLHPNELYAVGFESSAWHSSDQGATWKRINGYNFKAGLRVTPDPAHPGMVYINTFGGGVWYGPVDGPAVVEDIATRQVQP